MPQANRKNMFITESIFIFNQNSYLIVCEYAFGLKNNNGSNNTNWLSGLIKWIANTTVYWYLELRWDGEVFIGEKRIFNFTFNMFNIRYLWDLQVAELIKAIR